MPVDYGTILGALAQYFAGRGTSGDTPNMYPIPPSPREEWWDDRRRELYLAGGSPQQQSASEIARQVMTQMPRTANPQFASPMMRGQQFAGGVMLPQIDLSRFDFKPPAPGAGTGGAAPAPAGGDAVVPPPRTTGRERGPTETGPIEFPSSRPPIDPVTGRPWQGRDGGERDYASFRQWWDDFRAAHPNWAALGVAAVVGPATALFGPMAANWLRRAITGDRTTMPRATNTFANVARNAPGVQSDPGQVDMPPERVVPPSRAYRQVPGTGVVTGPGGRYAGGGNTEPTDTTMVPFGGGYFPGGGGPRFVLPQHPNSEPVDPMYAGNYYNLPK